MLLVLCLFRRNLADSFFFFIMLLIEGERESAASFLFIMLIVAIPIGIGVKRGKPYMNLESEIQHYADEQYGIEVTMIKYEEKSGNEIRGTVLPSETEFTVLVDEEGKFTNMQLVE